MKEEAIVNRKEIAQETLKIQQQGFYEYAGGRVDIAEAQRRSEKYSQWITPDQGAALVREGANLPRLPQAAEITVVQEATVKAIIDYAQAGRTPVGVLNFASAKKSGRRISQRSDGAGRESGGIQRVVSNSAMA